MNQTPDDTAENDAALRAELAGMRRLHALQVGLAAQADALTALDDLAALACDFARAECGCIQLVDAHSSDMQLRVYRGHDERSPFVQQFLKDGFQATCDILRRERRQLVIEDIEDVGPLQGTPDHHAALCSGIRAAQFTPLFNRAGVLLGVLGTQFTVPYRPAAHELRLLELLAWTAADYVERYRAELALRTSESRLAALSLASSEVHYRMSPDWGEMQALSGSGFLADTANPNRSWIMDYIPDEDRELVQRSIDAGIRSKSAIVFEHRVRRADGSIAWIATKAVPALDAEGRIAEWSGTATDITARRQAEERLRTSEARLAYVLDQVPLGVGLFDLQGRFTYKNTQLHDQLGEHIPSRDSVHGGRWKGFDHQGKPVAEEDYPGIRALRGEDATLPVDFLLLDGDTERWQRVSAVALRDGDKLIGGLTVVQEVTEQRRVQSELWRLAERNREILESISDAFYGVDAQWRFTYVNRQAEIVWGRPRTDLLGKVLWDEFPDTLGSAAHAAHVQAARTRQMVRVDAASPVRGHWVDISIYPTGDGGLSVYFRDITDRKRAEQQLRASEERFRTALTIETVGATYFDMEGRLTDANDAFVKMTGYRREDVDAGTLTWQSLTPPASSALSAQAFDELRANGSTRPYEREYLCKDGRKRWALFAAKLLPDGTGFEFVLDITDRKLAEAALREVQERSAFLLKLSDALRPLADPAIIQARAVRLLGEHLNAGRAYYVEMDAGAKHGAVERHWHRPGETSHAPRFAPTDWPLPWLGDARTWVVRDTATDLALSDAQRAAYLGNAIGALIMLPLMKGGQLTAAVVVDQRSARDWTPGEVRLAEETAERTWATLERARAQGALLDSEERHRLILASARDYAIFTTDASGYIQTWPPGAEAVFGWSAEEAVGRHMAMTFVAEDRNAGVPQRELELARRNGVAPNIRWHECKDGRRVFIEGATRPLRDDRDEPLGYLKIGQDVTRRRQWEDRQQVLLAELQHRTRNLMGVVRVVFNRTQRSSKTIAELALVYNDRLDALARVQGLLSRLNEGDRIVFDELIHVELSAMDAIDAQGRGERVVLDGPRGVRLRSSTVQTFALALHELATSANKYGALAQPGGRLKVRWRLLSSEGRTRLRIEWTETGVAMPAPGLAPQGSGYGRELIERALPYQLQADTSYVLGPDGVRCTIELPVSESMRLDDDQG
ncbi:PAS domain S-box protein [Xanthomonas nasturtii]|uniref:PAS domain S-box protein n=1 Tax=Xanthomonas nasturtii TaxID=1843581 RepID=UPI002012110B|nr:PAS domain S-box protein [Xanthomonas nasturtii]MCL1535746.1 PAS domain S-box protein [Xanthomonas nasturtii]MCL1545075.1 PAS domain S-box protein [Xanthomonas nasturtii]